MTTQRPSTVVRPQGSSVLRWRASPSCIMVSGSTSMKRERWVRTVELASMPEPNWEKVWWTPWGVTTECAAWLPPLYLTIRSTGKTLERKSVAAPFASSPYPKPQTSIALDMPESPLYKAITMAEFGLCPRCKVAPVARKHGKGKTGRCRQCCIDVGSPGHYDRNGIRYGTVGRKVIRACRYCGAEYPRRKKEPVSPVCDACLPRYRADKATERSERIKHYAYAQPSARQTRRTKAKLRKAGLPEDWLERQGNKCGICGSTAAGGKGSWHIDHDHTCCTYDKPGAIVGCAKCIRGILCYHCNTGLGHFRDDPTRLQAAIQWLARPTHA
jgi:hypothetical protein